MVAANGAIAIVGIGCRLPGGADTPERFWSLLRDGVDAITEIPNTRFDLNKVYDADPSSPGKLYARWGGFLDFDKIAEFDAAFFGLSPREAARIDPQHRLLLEVSWEALEDAGLPAVGLRGRSVGVFVGISTHDYGDVQMYPAHRLTLDAHSNTGTATSIAANRVSYLYDFRGPSLTIDTACSSALTATHLACRSLRAGECDVALVGGVQVLLVPELTIGFCKATMLSPDGRCKAFDARANGYVRSEGAGVVVLKPLSAALAAGDRIYAVIRGTAINQDGHTSGMTVPSAEAQAEMVRAALKDAALAPREIQYVEAHGTGTPVGDPIEASALGTALAEDRALTDRCAIGSVKTNIGHLEAASGIAGLIKTALALSHRELPPSLHMQEPNPAIDFDALRLRVVTELEDWPAPDEVLAAAGVSSFGFGGSNAHVVLQEWKSPPAPAACRPPGTNVLTLSARSPDALRLLAGEYVQLLSGQSPALYDVCATAALGRSHLEHRLSVVATSAEEAVEGLEAFRAGDRRANVVSGRVTAGGPPKLAFVFSGMGPQWWAMGRQLMTQEPRFRELVEGCDAILRPYARFSLMEELTRDESTSRVGEADLAQMTNFAIQVALVALWESWGIKPDAVIGHSAGEMAAAYTAGALDLEASVLLAYHRSRLQSRAAGMGRMLAVGLPPEQLVDQLSVYDGRVCLAAVNSPTSVTLTGDEEPLQQLQQALQDRQVFARLLPVEVPYHSRHMDPIQNELLQSLSSLAPRSTQIPMVSVVTGAWVEGSDLDGEYWWRNVRQPVQFAAGVECLVDAGFTTFLEVGPHPVLGVSIGECAAPRSSRAEVFASLRRMEDERGSMLRAAAALHAQGRDIGWSAIYPLPANQRVRLPLYPWQRERHWLDLSMSSEEGFADSTSAEHPLLGRRVRSAQPLWESSLGDQRLQYLEDHLVQGTLVFPGAAYVEMALAAGAADSTDSTTLRDVRFERALFIGDRSTTVLQLAVDAERGRWQIHSSTRQGGQWTRHASGQMERTSTISVDPVDLGEVRKACATSVDLDVFYAGLRRRGLHLGGAFASIRELSVGEGQALGVLELPDGQDAVPYTIHPALLDAAFQCLVGAVLGSAEGDTGGLFLPTSIDRIVQFAAPPTGRLHAVAEMRSRPGEAPAGDVRIIDGSGAVYLDIRGLRCQLLGTALAKSQDIDDWLYQYQWELKPLPRTTATSAITSSVDVASVAKRLQAEMDTRSMEWGWRDYYGVVEKRLNALAAAHIAACLEELGSSPEIIAERRALFDRLLSIRAEHTVDAALRDELATNLVREAPAYEAEVRLLDHCGRALAGVLSGSSDPREVLFGEQSQGLAARMYRDSPPSRVYNTLTAEAIAALLSEGQRTARILEVGGGTGGTTAYVLARLAGLQPEYTFTDISPAFTERVRLELAPIGELRTQTLDIERDPLTQGFAAHSFDVVVAANVLHATADLGQSVQNVRRLLAPGGMLILQEITRNPFWLDLIFGLTDGWWRFTDRSLRPTHPILAEDGWRGVLEGNGFEDVAVLHDTLSTGSSAQAVILARVSSEMRGAEWLIVGQGDGIATDLAGRLASLGRPSIRARDGMEAANAIGNVEELAGVVYLAEAPNSENVHGASVDLCADVLSVIQAVGRHERLSCNLHIVACGSQPTEHFAPSALEQGPLWGLARVAMREQARPRCRLIDLDPSDGAVEAIVQELLLDPGEREEEVAFRDGQRLIRRLRRVPMADLPALHTPLRSEETSDDAFRIQIATPGALDTLRLISAKRRSPGPGEVEIRVAAASLNFRDVMLAMGLLAPLATEDTFGGNALGIDCAGTVLAVGDGVDEFRAGDHVLGIAAGTLASHVTTSAELLAHTPAGLTPEQASSILCAFVTAEYGLLHLARLQPGERVLVHSATGGVGLAAIQVAKSVGAEIFATAGSPEKRAYLESLGIQHVMDSRTLQFADDILERTNGEGVDVVLNSLTGPAIEKGLSILRPYGRFVEIGKRDIYANGEIGLIAFRKNQSFFALDLDRLCAERPKLVGSLIRSVTAKLTDGMYQPVVHTVFPISRIEEAMRYLAQARHMGKVVLSLDDPDARSSDPDLFRGDGSYLITGGLGGFGLATAEWMARNGAGTVVLVGRNASSSDSRLEALRATGVRVHVRQTDIANTQATHALLEDLRATLPPLRGIVHAAMVLDDAPLDQLDADRLEKVMAPKVAGAWNLHALTTNDPLDHFVLFSSIASLLGNPLQANYAAANAFFAPLAAYRRARGLPALSVDWGVLHGTGYLSTREEVAQHLARQGYLSFDATSALGVLEALMRKDVAQMMVARMDWRTWARTSPTAATAPQLLEFAIADTPASESEALGERESIVSALAASIVPEERREVLMRFLRDRVARILGIGPGKLDVQAPIAELGFDSLMAVELTTVLRIELGVELGVVKLLQGVSLEGLADLILSELQLPAVRTVAPVAIDAPPPARVDPEPEVRAVAERPKSDEGADYSAIDYSKWTPRQRLARFTFSLAWRLLTQLNVEGVENLPSSGAYILAANHISLLDAPLVMTTLPRRTIVFAGERLRNSPVFHWFLSDLANAIYIQRGAGDVDALHLGLQVLRAGGTLAVGPEGGISQTGSLQQGQTGVAYLATQAKVPVVPVAAWGQERLKENWRQRRRPPVNVRVGTPIVFPDGEPDGLHLRMYTDQIMRAVADLLPAEYRGVYSKS